MKVILLRDVAKIGRRFEIVNVPDGYALNKLIPRKDAEPATPVNVKRVTQNKDRINANKALVSAELKEVVEKINKEPLVIIMDANEQGHLFQAVHAKDISKSAQEQKLNLTEDTILIIEPIKTTGEHKVFVKNQDQKLEITISVVAKKK
jgi:large subunit ribosomal protein L9